MESLKNNTSARAKQEILSIRHRPQNAIKLQIQPMKHSHRQGTSRVINYRAHSLVGNTGFGGIHHRCSHNRFQIGMVQTFLTDLHIVPAESIIVQYYILIPIQIGHQWHFHLLNNEYRARIIFFNNACISKLEKSMITKKVENYHFYFIIVLLNVRG